MSPGATTKCTFTHTIAQADLDNGRRHSHDGHGHAAVGVTVTNVSGTVTVPGVQAAQLAVTKSTTATNYKVAGEVLDYSVTVRNTGNVTLTVVASRIRSRTGPISCSATTLAPLAYRPHAPTSTRQGRLIWSSVER